MNILADITITTGEIMFLVVMIIGLCCIPANERQKEKDHLQRQKEESDKQNPWL